jgi:hypothetical protein
MLKRLCLLLALSLAPLEDAHASCTTPAEATSACEDGAAAARNPASVKLPAPRAAEAVNADPSAYDSLTVRARFLESRFNKI